MLKPRGVQSPAPSRPPIQLEPKVIQLLFELSLTRWGFPLRDKELVHMLHHTSCTYGIDEAMILSNLFCCDSLILPCTVEKMKTVKEGEGHREASESLAQAGVKWRRQSITHLCWFLWQSNTDHNRRVHHSHYPNSNPHSNYLHRNYVTGGNGLAC